MSGLALERVTVALGGRDVVREVTVAIAEREWLALIGPNGAGKSTLLRAVAGLVAHSGRIALGGSDIASLGRRERARRVAVVAQQPELPEGFRVAEYVLLGRTPYIPRFGRESGVDHATVAGVLERLDLVGLADRALGELSGGERQRAIVARALAQEPEVLLLDEPTSALDVGRQVQVLELVHELRAEAGLTVVSATHDLTLAAAYADRVALISHGALVSVGSPADVLRPETLAEHYDASLHVIVDPDGGIAVVPRRPSSTVAGRAGPWPRGDR